MLDMHYYSNTFIKPFIVLINNNNSCRASIHHHSKLLAKKPNHYETLGISRTATQTQIKDAYYSKSKLFHPDSTSSTRNSTGGGATPLSAHELEQRQRKFVELKQAYDILRRPADRRLYDEQLSSGAYNPRYPHYRASTTRTSYAPPPQYEHYGQDWRKFWAKASGPDHMSAEEIRKRDQQQWAVIIRYTLIGLAIVFVYHVGYLLLVLQRNRELDSLVDKDEIAKSFLRQREFADRRDDPEHAQHLAQVLRADIDEAYRRKMATLEGKNPREIREEYRWMNAVRFVDPSKRFRLRRRVAIEEEHRQAAAAAAAAQKAADSMDGASALTPEPASQR